MKLKVALLLLVASTAYGDITSIVTSPAGGNGDVQFNQNRRFGADPSSLSYSTTTKRLTVPGLVVSTLTINGQTYIFTSTPAAGGTFAQNDGAGGISWQTPTFIGVSTGANIAVKDNGINISSPTSALDFFGPQFIVSLQGSTTALIKVDPSSVTLLGPSIDLGSEVTGSLPAASIAAGNLGASVVASSIAVNAVTDSAIVSVTGSKVTGNIPGNAAGITGTVNVSQVNGAVSVYAATATASFPFGFAASTAAFNSFNTTRTSSTANGTAGFTSQYGVITSSVVASTVTLSGQIVFADGTLIRSTTTLGGSGGSGGVTVYAATATASFPFGLSASTVAVTRSINAAGQTIFIASGTPTYGFYTDPDFYQLYSNNNGRACIGFHQGNDSFSNNPPWSECRSGTTFSIGTKSVTGGATQIIKIDSDGSFPTGSTVTFATPVVMSQLTAGNVLFPDANKSLTGSSNFTWDTTAGALNLGGGAADATSWMTVTAGSALNSIYVKGVPSASNVIRGDATGPTAIKITISNSSAVVVSQAIGTNSTTGVQTVGDGETTLTYPSGAHTAERLWLTATGNIINSTDPSYADMYVGHGGVAIMPIQPASSPIAVSTPVADLHVGWGTRAPSITGSTQAIVTDYPGDSYLIAIDSTTGTNTFFGVKGGQSVLGTSTNTWVLPTADGTNGQFLKTNGSQVLSWGTASGGILQITSSGVEVTSPTASVNFNANDFSLRAIGTTSYVLLNPATTDFIHNQTTAQTATFNVSSGTVSTQLNTSQLHFNSVSSAILHPDNTVLLSIPDVNSMHIGYNTNLINTGAVFNFSAGPTAMPYPGTGAFNSCVGPFCMSGNTISGQNNNAMGYATCGNLRAGFYNNCMGGSSGNALRDGNYNTNVGAYSGFSNIDNNGNTQIGFETGRYQDAANYTAAVGYQAGSGTATVNANYAGSENSYFGKNTGQDVSSSTVITKSFAIGTGALFHASQEGQLGGRLGSGNEVMVRMTSATIESTLQVSSNTFLPGATFYQNGIIKLNSANFSVSLPLQTDSARNMVSSAIDLGTTQAGGTLAAARMPGLTGDVTTVAGNVATTLATTIANAHTFSGAISLGTVAGNKVQVSSNTILVGTTFYQNGTTTMDGPVTMGTLSTAVTISSNAITPGATFYQNGIIGLNPNTFSASLPLQTNASRAMVSLGIDLSGSQATGTMAAARMPALTGDVTTSAGAVATTMATTIANSHTFSGVVTFSNSANAVTLSAGQLRLFSRTVAQIGAITPGAVGEMLFCSDCTALQICVSSGTGVGAFASPVAKTTVCK